MAGILTNKVIRMRADQNSLLLGTGAELAVAIPPWMIILPIVPSTLFVHLIISIRIIMAPIAPIFPTLLPFVKLKCLFHFLLCLLLDCHCWQDVSWLKDLCSTVEASLDTCSIRGEVFYHRCLCLMNIVVQAGVVEVSPTTWNRQKL